MTAPSLKSVTAESNTAPQRLRRSESVWRAFLWLTSLLALLGSQAVTASEDHAGLVKAKPRGRSIHFEVVIPASPEDVFASWTTEAGANQFFGTASTIQEHVGGLYEITFDGELPNGNAPGTTGTRILYFDRNRALAFEWQAPFFADELNTSPLPTWVELTFEPHSGQDGTTVLRLDHHGFGTGETWDRVRTFFELNWFEVLFRLRTLYEQERAAGIVVPPVYLSERGSHAARRICS